MISAFGVDHGRDEFAKSLIDGKFVRAVDVGAKKLRDARTAAGHDPYNFVDALLRMKVPADKAADAAFSASKDGLMGGRYRSTGLDAEQAKVLQNKAMVTEHLSQLAGRDLSGKPSEAIEFVGTKSGKYKNAHPLRYGSAKGGRTYVISDKRDGKTVQHELLHSEGRSSWRLAQIQSDPVKLAREEARADTLSGTHSQIHRSPLLRSHTQMNRANGDKADKLRVKAIREKGKSERASGLFGQTYHGMRAGAFEQAANTGSAFKRTQDKIDADGRYGVKEGYARYKRRRNIQRASLAAGAGTGGVVVAAYQTKDGRKVAEHRRKSRGN